jgi:hypothetical protein
MIAWLKHIIKKYFQIIWIKHRFSPQVQIAQRQLFLFYSLHHSNQEKINLASSGYRVFSQFEEDGKILFILSCIGMKSYTFLEIGSADGLNSNCANLALNFGYHGVFIDADKQSVERGRYFYNRYPNRFTRKPVFVLSKVTRENVNDLIRSARLEGEIDLLSIDIDGNDYWIWDAISVVNPRIVIIETFIDYGLRDMVVPYDPAYVFPGRHPQYHGASPVSMVKLGKKKGYRLVGSNQLGFNFMFVRDDLAPDLLPEVSVVSILEHPSVIEEKVDPKVLSLPFVQPIP